MKIEVSHDNQIICGHCGHITAKWRERCLYCGQRVADAPLRPPLRPRPPISPEAEPLADRSS